jgi:hypothetical protein
MNLPGELLSNYLLYSYRRAQFRCDKNSLVIFCEQVQMTVVVKANLTCDELQAKASPNRAGQKIKIKDKE